MRLLSPQSQGERATAALIARPSSLAGLRIGLLDNTKAPVDLVMAHLAQRLSERIPGVSTFTIAKEKMGAPASAAVMDQLAANADVVINALGD